MVQLPALNTPQFDWVLSRLPRKPQPVPPIYQPEVAARAILWASEHDRGEVFVGMYRPAPGGITRMGPFTVCSPDALVAELQSRREEVVLVGDGALRYRHQLATLGGQVEFASAALANPQATSLVELSVPRLEREESDRVLDVLPLYLRKSDAEIAWDKRARAG